MVFSSLIFLCVFLPAVLLAYNLSRNISYKNVILVIASLVFYAWGEPVWVILLIISGTTDYFHGLIIDRYRSEKRGIARAALISSLVINIGILAVFKYSGFLIGNLNAVTGLTLTVPAVTLPIGISFYTFQTLSYTIDVYRGQVRVQRSLLSFLTYVSMFPQLVAGPIVRYRDISKSLHKRTVTADDFAVGSRKFVCGLCKKVMLANNAGAAAETLLSGIQVTTMSSWLGAIFFTFQIYFDFSGYSDMAIGLGRMLGFRFRENFEHPYISRSITEFWRRWHISLSSFFRDYVYIPLGGNRKHQILNLFIVWLLTGLWHGASWNFIFWGLFYGVILIIEKKFIGGRLQRIPFPFCHLYTMLIVVVGWVIFYFTDIESMKTYLLSMAGVGCNLYDLVSISVLYQNVWLLAMCVIASLPLAKLLYNHLSETYPALGAVLEPLVIASGFALCFITLTGQTYNPFLYFRF